MSSKSGRFKNPFDQSDRDPIGRNAGKGDRDRSDPRAFKAGFPSSMGPKRIRGGRFRKVY